MFRDTPNVLYPPVDSPESVVSQPAAAYDSNAALSTSQIYGYSDVAHPDAMYQGSQSYPTSHQVEHNYYPTNLAGFGALSLPSGQTHAMQEPGYGGPALGTHHYAGEELTAANIPFMGMRSESTKKEGDFTREVPPRYFSGEDGRRLEDAEINNLIKQGEAIIQEEKERPKKPHPKASYVVRSAGSKEVDWMRRVYEARMRRFLPKKFDNFDRIVIVSDEENKRMDPSNVRAGAKLIIKKQQQHQNDVGTSSKTTTMPQKAPGPWDFTLNPLSDFTLNDVHFHVLTSNRAKRYQDVPVGDFRVLAVFPPDQQDMRILMSFGILSIKEKDGDKLILSGGIARDPYADGGAPRRDGGDRGRSGGGKRKIGER
ncbi:hypothetical protein ACQY0O_004807 [Thecaphora frezii]